MDKAAKTAEKDHTLAWLLRFEKAAGQPVVVSVLIERGGMEFISSIKKRVYFSSEKDEDHEDEGDDVPEIDLKKKLANIRSTELNIRNYIG